MLKLKLVSRNDLAALVEDQEAGASSALVDGSNEGDVLGSSVYVNHCVVCGFVKASLKKGRQHSRTKGKREEEERR